MDFSWLNGMAPFMVAASVNSDRKVNGVRLMEAAISAIIIAIVSTSAAAYVTLRIVESQTKRTTPSVLSHPKRLWRRKPTMRLTPI